MGAPKTPFSYASLVFFLRRSLINEEVVLNENVLGFIFTFCKIFWGQDRIEFALNEANK